MASDTPQPPTESRDVPPNGDTFRASWFGTVTSVLNVLGTLLILAMALAVNADVTGRNLFNQPIPGVLEFVGLSIVAVVFLQMANTLREGRHVANDILMRLLSDARPRLSAGLYTVFNLVGAVLMGLVVWFVWPILMANYLGGYYRGTAGLVEVPVWPFIAAVVVGAAATAVQFLLLAWREFEKATGRVPVQHP